ncbi:MAG: AAA family ATPase [Lachnospiraceae bacterium]|nr:AAA family ATPase [Lachnospiraceae bacterium]
MIEYLYANNYKTLVNFKIEFGKTNVLIGKSGSGKSSILFLLACIRSFMEGTVNTIALLFAWSFDS